jgi:triacylglycerol lipase
MADHLTLPVSHTWMAVNPVVIAQVLTYLQTGRFAPAMTLRQAVRLVSARAPHG